MPSARFHIHASIALEQTNIVSLSLVKSISFKIVLMIHNEHLKCDNLFMSYHHKQTQTLFLACDSALSRSSFFSILGWVAIVCVSTGCLDASASTDIESVWNEKRDARVSLSLSPCFTYCDRKKNNYCHKFSSLTLKQSNISHKNNNFQHTRANCIILYRCK